MNDIKILVGGTIFDATGAPPIENGAVMIRDNQIQQIFQERDFAVPENAQVIDVHGGFIMPGLVNAHDHLSWDTIAFESPVDVSSLINTHDAYLALRAARSGVNFLRSGVTTVRNLGEVRFVDLQYKRAFEENLVPGPRVVASGPWVVTSHAWITFPGVPTCDGTEEVRKFVRTNLRGGADLIKIFIGGELLGLCNTNPHLTYITKEELETAITEAHLKGKMVTAHIMSSQSPGFRWAVDAGIDTLEHGIWLTEDDFRLMKSRGINLVVAGGWWLDGGFADEIYPDARKIVQNWYERVFRSEVFFAIGVDGRGEVGAMQTEVERLVRYGLDNKSALIAATKHGAIVCGYEDKLGTIESGKLADIIVVEGNPIKQIDDLKNVRMVIKSGRLFNTQCLENISLPYK